MIVAEALDVRTRSISFREAEIFLSHVLKKERSWLHAHSEITLTPDQEKAFESCLSRREKNEPVAYITGVREFYGRPFMCDKRALIPRPETEGLIDRALDFLPKHFNEHLKETNKPCPLRILELGTGVGNIAITLSIELTSRHIPFTLIATDISNEALDLAQENWKGLAPASALAPIWLEADLFEHTTIKEQASFDLIIANLPYVPSTWQQDPLAQAEVVFQEPDIALFGGQDGLDIYRRFFQQAASFLKEDGLILVEYNEDQTTQIKKLAAAAFPQKEILAHQDYAELDRLLEIK